MLQKNRSNSNSNQHSNQNQNQNQNPDPNQNPKLCNDLIEDRVEADFMAAYPVLGQLLATHEHTLSHDFWIEAEALARFFEMKSPTSADLNGLQLRARYENVYILDDESNSGGIESYTILQIAVMLDAHPHFELLVQKLCSELMQLKNDDDIRQAKMDAMYTLAYAKRLANKACFEALVQVPFFNAVQELDKVLIDLISADTLKVRGFLCPREAPDNDLSPLISQRLFARPKVQTASTAIQDDEGKASTTSSKSTDPETLVVAQYSRATK